MAFNLPLYHYSSLIKVLLLLRSLIQNRILYKTYFKINTKKYLHFFPNCEVALEF